MPGEPTFDLRILVNGAILHDQMEIELGRKVLLHASQEGEVLLVTVGGLHWVITSPVAISRAANSVVVPCRW